MDLRNFLRSIVAVIIIIINISGMEPSLNLQQRSYDVRGKAQVYAFDKAYGENDEKEQEFVAIDNGGTKPPATNVIPHHETFLQSLETDIKGGNQVHAQENKKAVSNNNDPLISKHWFTQLVIHYTASRRYQVSHIEKEQEYKLKKVYVYEDKTPTNKTDKKDDTYIDNYINNYNSSSNKNTNKSRNMSDNNNNKTMFTEYEIHDLLNKGLHEPLKAREKRRAVTHTVELLFAVDYAAYQWWNILSADFEIHVMDLITEYYAYIFRGLKMRFENIEADSYHIDAVLRGIHVANSENDSYWTLTSILEVNDDTPRTIVNSSEALEKFQEWLDSNDTTLPQFDHAILFTGTNLSYAGNTGNTGLAFGASMCLNISNSSIVEDSFDYRTITYASQQLARSLGSNDDMDNNDCLEFFSYIMAPKFKLPVRSFAPNRWKFSACSQQYMKDYLTSIDDLGLNCLENSPNDETFPTDISNIVKDKPLGFIYNAKRQCQNRFGFPSDVCRLGIRSSYSEICTGLLCSLPNTGSCEYLLPADGTACGNKKYCWHGECQYFEDALVSSDTCAFGDEPGFECHDVIQDNDAACYDDNVRYRCCQTCESIALDIPGCEFGDRVLNCSLSECDRSEEMHISRDCCKTCGIVQTTFNTSTTNDKVNDDVTSPSLLTINSVLTASDYSTFSSGYSTFLSQSRKTNAETEISTLLPTSTKMNVLRTSKSNMAFSTLNPSITATDANDGNFDTTSQSNQDRNRCVCPIEFQTATDVSRVPDVPVTVSTAINKSQICGKDFIRSIIKDVSKSMRTSQRMVQGHMHKDVNALFNDISAKLRKHQGDYEIEHEGMGEGSEGVSESEENINLRLRPLWVKHYHTIMANLNQEIRDMRYKVMSLLYRQYNLP